jgi:hypothetical protein
VTTNRLEMARNVRAGLEGKWIVEMRMWWERKLETAVNLYFAFIIATLTENSYPAPQNTEAVQQVNDRGEQALEQSAIPAVQTEGMSWLLFC